MAPACVAGRLKVVMPSGTVLIGVWAWTTVALAAKAITIKKWGKFHTRLVVEGFRDGLGGYIFNTVCVVVSLNHE